MPDLNDVFRAIGRIEGQLEGLHGKVDALTTRVDTGHTPLTCPLRGDVEDLKTFKWRVTGIASIVSFIGGAIVSLIVKYWPWGKT